MKLNILCICFDFIFEGVLYCIHESFYPMVGAVPKRSQ